MLQSNAISNLDHLRTVFLDRDGVVNQKPPEGQYVGSWEEFHLLPGVAEAIARLNQRGLRVVVVSNQRGIALNCYTIADVLAIHAALQETLAACGAHVDGFYFCPHDKEGCRCRKPLPGLFEQAAAAFAEITPATSVMIGDSLSDMEFGVGLGMPTILIDGDSEHPAPGREKARSLANARCASLAQAAEMIAPVSLPAVVRVSRPALV